MKSRYYLIITIPLLMSFNLSYSILSVDQVTSKYPNPQSLQIAIDQCQISYDDLPHEIKMLVSSNKYCNVTVPTQTNLSDTLNTFTQNQPILFFGVMFLVILFFVALAVQKVMFPKKSKKDNIDSLIHGLMGKERFIQDELNQKYLSEKPTSDKIKNISMDNYKTKEDHPMGSKTHD